MDRTAIDQGVYERRSRHAWPPASSVLPRRCRRHLSPQSPASSWSAPALPPGTGLPDRTRRTPGSLTLSAQWQCAIIHRDPERKQITAELLSLDFVVNRFLVKLFNSSDMQTTEFCPFVGQLWWFRLFWQPGIGLLYWLLHHFLYCFFPMHNKFLLLLLLLLLVVCAI